MECQMKKATFEEKTTKCGKSLYKKESHMKKATFEEGGKSLYKTREC